MCYKPIHSSSYLFLNVASHTLTTLMTSFCVRLKLCKRAATSKAVRNGTKKKFIPVY